MKLTRRGFIGTAVGTVAATGLPFIARKPALAPTEPVVWSGRWARGKLRTYIYINHVLCDGPEVTRARLEPTACGWRIVFDVEEIISSVSAHFGPFVIADANGAPITTYREVNYDLRPDDRLKITAEMSFKTDSSFSIDIAEHLAKAFLEAISV